MGEGGAWRGNQRRHYGRQPPRRLCDPRGSGGYGRTPVSKGKAVILVLHKKLEKLFIAPKVRQELHETTFVAFATKGQRE